METKWAEKWDRRFLRLALEVRTWVKGPDQGVGCVLVNPDRRIIATGYSGFPYWIDDDKIDYTAEIKDEFMVHAEANALLNATSDTSGATAYITKAPCLRCANKLWAHGVKTIVCPPPDADSRWFENQSNALHYLTENGTQLRLMSTALEEIKKGI